MVATQFPFPQIEKWHRRKEWKGKEKTNKNNMKISIKIQRKKKSAKSSRRPLGRRWRRFYDVFTTFLRRFYDVFTTQLVGVGVAPDTHWFLFHSIRFDLIWFRFFSRGFVVCFRENVVGGRNRSLGAIDWYRYVRWNRYRLPFFVVHQRNELPSIRVVAEFRASFYRVLPSCCTEFYWVSRANPDKTR